MPTIRQQGIRQDFRAFIEKDLGVLVTIYQPDETLTTIAAGTAAKQDITGWTIRFQDRIKAAYEALQLELDVTVINGPTGLALVQFVVADTLGWVPALHEYMIERTGSGTTYPTTYGTIEWLASASR